MSSTDLRESTPAVQRVSRVLQAAGHPETPVWLDVSARTAQEAADALGVQLGQIAKSIVFRQKAAEPAHERVVLVVTSGDRRVDEKRVAALVGPIGRADAEFVKSRTGFAIGGVSPVAHAHPPQLPPRVLIDRELARFEVLWAAAGHPNAVFKLSPAQLCSLTRAELHDVVIPQH